VSIPRSSFVDEWGAVSRMTDEELLAQPDGCFDEAFGWPWLSLWYPVQASPLAKGHALRGGIDLIALTGRTADQYRAIPLLPIWPGLLLNTAFYGTLWALLLFGLPLLRQTRRRRKGRCPRCNYDLKRDLEHGCPECGWRRQGGA